MLVKNLPASVSLVEIVFFRCFFGLSVVAFFGFLEGKARNHSVFKLKNPFSHLGRCIFSTLSLFCFIAAFRLMPLADAYALTFSTPLFMACLSGPFLGERVRSSQWIAVFFGFLGVMIMLRPGLSPFNWGSYIALAGGFFYALTLLLIRDQSQRDSASLLVGSSVFCALLTSAFFLPWRALSFENSLLYMFMGIGFLGVSAQYAMTYAFRLASVSSIAPFDYLSLVWATFLGYICWGDFPDEGMILGGSAIVLAGLYLIRSERSYRRRKEQALLSAA